jgi:hypothetical protein
MAQREKKPRIDIRWWLSVLGVTLAAGGAGFALGLWLGR